MNITQEIFGRRRPVRDKLIRYGFTEVTGAPGLLWYREDFMDGALRAEVFVRPDGTVESHAVDLDTGEEYTPINVEAQQGAYVGAAREAYRAILERTAEECFTEVPFLSDQANRIAAKIRERYGVEPEFLWPDRLPGAGVFRHPRGRKWFSIVMAVPRGKLEGESGEDLVDAMNVKIDPAQLDALLKEPGICRCYHMNKKQWVTLCLDGRLTDERVLELLTDSFERTRGGSSGQKKLTPQDPSVPRGRQYWIIPSNPKYFDVEGGFRANGGILLWHQRIKAQAGDIVYIYQTEPVASLKFRCLVERADIPREDPTVGKSPTVLKLMEIRLLQTYETGLYPRKWLNEHGIAKTVRGQRSAPQELAEAMEPETDASR